MRIPTISINTVISHIRICFTRGICFKAWDCLNSHQNFVKPKILYRAMGYLFISLFIYYVYVSPFHAQQRLKAHNSRSNKYNSVYVRL